MKFVIQRVLQGSVKVNEKIVGEIGPGLVVLVGFTHTDKKENLKFAANKLLSMRLWDDDKGTRWKECLKDKKFGLLVVSQFTLYSFLKGNKPDYHNALEPKSANALYEEFLKILKQIYDPEKVQSGMFGEMMQVSLINDGPVTINLEYPEMQEKDTVSDNYKGIKNVKEVCDFKNEKEKGKEVKKGNNKNNCENQSKNKIKADDKNDLCNKKNEDVFEIEKDLDRLKIKVQDKLDEIDSENIIENESNNVESKNPDLIKLPKNMK